MGNKIISKEELERRYIIEGKSMQEIADVLDITFGKVRRFMEKWDIPRRSVKEVLISRNKKGALPLKKEKIENLYQKEQKSIQQIADMLGFSYTGIHNAFLRLNINRRSRFQPGAQKKAAMARTGVPPWNIGTPLREQLHITFDEWCRRKTEGELRMPNKLEQLIITIIQRYKCPFKYVGDGKIWINGKNPDFINYNGEKQLIEIFGDYWHDKDDEAIRSLHFLQYGFKTLILWEHEINQLSEKEIFTKIKEFTEAD